MSGIQIFVTETTPDGSESEEITDLYWFEENGVHEFIGWHDGRQYGFEVHVDGKIVWPVVVKPSIIESWRNGWPRINSHILISSSLHCCGCGKFHGVITVAIDTSNPGKSVSDPPPDYPFDEENCPVCWLEGRLREARNI